MDWLTVIVMGGVIGWLASLLMKADTRPDLLLNIATGIIGAIAGRWLFTDALGIGAAYSTEAINLPGLLFGVLGATILLALLKLLRLPD